MISYSMAADATTVLSTCYVASNLAFTVMYVPRLRRMLRDDAAAVNANSLGAELFWLLCRFVSMAYVSSVAQQALIATTVMLDIAARGAIVAVLLRARSRMHSRIPLLRGE